MDCEVSPLFPGLQTANGPFAFFGACCSAAALVLDQPARVTTTFAVLALFAVILASGSFLGVLVEVRRNL